VWVIYNSANDVLIPGNGFFILYCFSPHFPPIAAPPRQCIDLHFEENYSIESSWECKFDNIEVRDGPFGFSPVMGRYCGQHSPPDIRSSGRYLWIKFVTDGELEAVGFSARYNFTAGNRRFFFVFFLLCGALMSWVEMYVSVGNAIDEGTHQK
jgi:hypothetical protein